MTRTISPVLATIEEDEDGNKYGVPMRRLFREIRDSARAGREPADTEKGVIDAARAKRDRRRQRNLDRA